MDGFRMNTDRLNEYLSYISNKEMTLNYRKIRNDVMFSNNEKDGGYEIRYT